MSKLIPGMFGQGSRLHTEVKVLKIHTVQREEILGLNGVEVLLAPKNNFRSLIDARWGRIFAINSIYIYR